MPTNADAIRDLETAKQALEAQVPAATGKTADNLMLAIQEIADEVGALAAAALTNSYVPQTDAFKAVTKDAKTFVATLNSIKRALALVAQLAEIVDNVISYIR